MKGAQMSSLVDYKNKNGIVYVYQNVSTWNKQTKRPNTQRTCIGKRDPITNEIIHNKKYLEAHGMLEIKKVTAPTVLQYGVSILFDKISVDTGLRTILKECFPQKWQKILTLSYYFAAENKAVHHIDTWSTLVKTPYCKKISSQRVSELCKELTEEEQARFFNAWMKHNLDDGYHAMDITSVSSYSALNEMVKYGYNRDGEKLPQINMLMITGNNSKVPCYYEILPGSIRDVNTLNKVIADMDWMERKHLHLVLDKGFYSAENITMLYKYHHKFIVGMSFVSTFSNDCVERVQSSIMDIENYINLHGNDLYATSFLEKWDGHRMYVHVYYDSAKADGEYREFSRKIRDLKIELETKEVTSHMKDYEKYFIVKETPKRGRKVIINTEAVETYRNKRAGYFVLASNDEKDPIKALEVYRNKDIVEKSFDNLKSTLDSKRMRTHSKETMQGRFFLQFISLILTMDIQNKMQKQNLYKRFSYPTLIGELKTLSAITYPGKRKITFTEFTKGTKDIYKAFGIDPKTYV
jgi:transposase